MMLIICKKLKNKIISIIDNINKDIIKKELKEKIAENLIKDIEEIIQNINLGNQKHKKNQNDFFKNNELFSSITQ